MYRLRTYIQRIEYGRTGTYMLPVRWSLEEKNLMEKQAAEEGLSVSAFIRTTVIKYCRKANREE